MVMAYFIAGPTCCYLQGLKMKKIKSLCRHQLAQLDQNVLERVINGEQESVLPPHELESSNHEDICDGLEVTPPTDHCQEPTKFSDISDNEEASKRKQQKADTLLILEAEIDMNPFESTDSDVPGENGPEPEDVIAISPPIMDEVDVELAGVKSMKETSSTLSTQRHMVVRKRKVKIVNEECSSVVEPRQYHHSDSLPVAKENNARCKRKVKIVKEECPSVVEPRQYHHSDSLPVAKENNARCKRKVKIVKEECPSVVEPRQYHHSDSLPVAKENSVSPSSTESELREKLLLKAKCRESLQGHTDKKSVLNPSTLELEMKEKALRSLLMKTVRKPQTT